MGFTSLQKVLALNDNENMRQLIEIKLKIPITIKTKGKFFVSSCPVLDVYTQGDTEREAKKNIFEAVQLFIMSCIERGTLDAALRELGFVPGIKPTGRHGRPTGNFITIPIPLQSLSHKPPVCHA
ncbi:MAG: hypothetical protein C0402_00725 [Thermodesulfovibrio sp.]|nr:hypothetical protein [Thermodesulfovibrio sp.]